MSAIIERDGKYLMGKKPKGRGPYMGTWHLLGGGINLGEESPEEAIKREIWEEARIKIKNIEKITFSEDITKNHEGDEIQYIFLTHRAQYDSGELKPGDDIAELKWFNRDELKKIPLNPPTVRLFKELGWL